MHNCPLARTEDIVVSESGSELLIYDLKTNKAICLNQTSALVWQLCDGRNSVAEIGDEMSKRFKTPIDKVLVWLALDQLNTSGLLDDSEMVIKHLAGVSRRDLIRKIGFATVIALPLVSSIVAPMASAAASGCGAGVCFMAGTEVCTGCVGGVITGTRYNSTDGSCSGGATGIPWAFVCGSLTFASNDVIRN